MNQLEFEINKFKKIVLDSMMSKYDIKQDAAKKIIDRSTFAEMIWEDPEFIGHYSAEYWADQIFEESSLIQY
ncbi:hypothetical protein D3C75_518340 [compost metagenome]